MCLLVLVAGSFSLAGDKEADPKSELKQAITRGSSLFVDESLGTNGMSCNSCHADGGTKPGKMGDMEIPPFKNVGDKYPGYFKMAGKVMTLDQVINFCVTTPMEGKALAWDDQRMADLAAYITWVHAMKHEKGGSKEKEMKKEKKEG
jgi:thiosulfate dehydrogenase